MSQRKKLIEVALPLEAINREAAREKSIRHGHPSTLHLWWARRPLAACRAVLFASLVDDPSSHPDLFPTAEAQEQERDRLFRLMEDLVKWENSTNEAVLEAARHEILRSCDGAPPTIYDPFCGGGSIPLEAQRLGLEAHASDLNPVAVLITKALIEIPPKFANRPPVHPGAAKEIGINWKGTMGLAEDIRYYGRWMRDEAEKRIGHLYPKVALPRSYGGGEATVIAWTWARTVGSPNPAARGMHVPLVRSFALSTKIGKKAWVEPVIDTAAMTYRFEIRTGEGEPRQGTVNRRGATCLLTGASIPLEYIRSEGKAGRMKQVLMAIVAQGRNTRIYLPPDPEHERIARSAVPPDDVPDTDMVVNSRYMTPTGYGMTKHCHLFTDRQLVALTTLCDLVREGREKVLRDTHGDRVYPDAVATYLAFATTRIADRHSNLTAWDSSPTKLQIAHTFTRNALSMVWDFAEGNPFCTSSGGLEPSVEWVAKVTARLHTGGRGQTRQLNAQQVSSNHAQFVFSTDPPYYDNVPYADLSDFFYVWLRRALSSAYPEVLSTVLVPKAEELVADPFRHGGRRASQNFFENGMRTVFNRIRESSDPRFPTTIYYAFKQQEENEDNNDSSHNGEHTSVVRASTGWETFLQSLVDTGWQVDGTWPMRTELGNRMRNLDSNALASSIVLVCRALGKDAKTASRREFLMALRRELPESLRLLQKGNTPPVDLAQAAIGPGMAIFSRYSKVIENDGSPMRVRTALTLINQTLDELLAEQEGDLDRDTTWAIAWFDQFGFEEGPYGVAETLCTAKNTAIQPLVDAGIVVARAGKVRLRRVEELPDDWDANSDRRRTSWECVHHLIKSLREGGETGAASLARELGTAAEPARELAYRLFILAERRKRAQDALAYNALVVSWPEIFRLAHEKQAESSQSELGI